MGARADAGVRGSLPPVRHAPAYRLREAIALFEHQQLHEEIAEALLTLADVYRQMRGRYVDEGERVLDNAYQSGRLLPDSPLRARLLMRYHRCKGRHLLTAGDSTAALEQFAHAQRIAQVEDDWGTQALMHIHLAHCHALHGDARAASACLDNVPQSYLRAHPKEALYFRVERAAVRHTGRLAPLSRDIIASKHTDLTLLARLAAVAREQGDRDTMTVVCDRAIGIIENARRRLKTPHDMREFREFWSVFYQLGVTLRLDAQDPHALWYHIMNQSRTLSDLLVSSLPLVDAGCRDSTLSAVENALKGDRGGMALRRGKIHTMLNVVLNALPTAMICFPTWYEGTFGLMWARREGSSLAACLGARTARIPDTRTPTGRCRAQEEFGRWLQEMAESRGPVVVIPDDCTRHIAFHTALVNGEPAFCVAPVIYHLSLPLLAARCREVVRMPPGAASVSLLYGRDSRPIGADRELAAIAATMSAAGHETPTPAPADVGTLARALDASDVVHIAAHHVVSADIEGFSHVAGAGEASISTADVLGLQRPHARLVVSAQCDSAVTHSGIFNEPYGLLSALLLTGVRGIVAARAPISGEESCAWMREFYGILFGERRFPDFVGSYRETMTRMYAQWGSREQAGKFVYFGC